MAKKQLF